MRRVETSRRRRGSFAMAKPVGTLYVPTRKFTVAIVIKLPDGSLATLSEDGVWSHADLDTARYLALVYFEPSGYSPDPLATYAEAVAQHVGGTIVSRPRKIESKPGVIY